MIRRATKNDIAEVARLMLALWPHHSFEEMRSEAEESMARPDQAVFLCVEGRPCGFAICSIRRDWVEGSSSSPVGYLEGIYVAPGSRRKGIARGLLSACQAWAVEQGCSEFASDCEVENADSEAFHLHCGFRVVSRIVCFIKPAMEGPTIEGQAAASPKDGRASSTRSPRDSEKGRAPLGEEMKMEESDL